MDFFNAINVKAEHWHGHVIKDEGWQHPTRCFFRHYQLTCDRANLSHIKLICSYTIYASSATVISVSAFMWILDPLLLFKRSSIHDVLGTTDQLLDRHRTNCYPPCTTSSTLCARCLNLPCCSTCERYFPRYCFDESSICLACEKRTSIPHTRQSTQEIVTEVDDYVHPEDVTFRVFMDRNIAHIQQIVDDYHKRIGSIRVHCTADPTFVREENGVGVMRVPGYFSTDPQDVTTECHNSQLWESSGLVQQERFWVQTRAQQHLWSASRNIVLYTVLVISPPIS